jgi:hypothetical protein
MFRVSPRGSCGKLRQAATSVGPSCGLQGSGGLPRIDRRALEERLQAKLEDYRGLLMRDLPTANAMLRTLLDEPIRFTPVLDEGRRGYQFE